MQRNLYRKSVGLLAFMAFVLAALAGCQAEISPQFEVLTAVTLPAGAPCPDEETTEAESNDIDSYELYVIDPEQQLLSAKGGPNSLVIEDLTPGSVVPVSLYGFIGNTMKYRGYTPALQLPTTENTEVSHSILIAPVDEPSCTRTPMTRPRAWHTATKLDDGRVLLTGGAISPQVNHLEAIDTAVVYDPERGRFGDPINMENGRFFHSATKLNDGRVLISGGTTSAVFHPRSQTGTTDGEEAEETHPFPIEVGTVLAEMEIFDPDENIFLPVSSDPLGPRVFHASTKLPDGSILLSGGIPEHPETNDLANALATTTVCKSNGGAVQCEAGAEMTRHRAGHFGFIAKDNDLVIVGGSMRIRENSGDGALFNLDRFLDVSFDALSASNAEGELESDFETYVVCGNNQQNNVFFAGYGNYDPGRVLMAGGLVRDAQTGDWVLARSGGTEGPIYIYQDVEREGCDNYGIVGGTLEPLRFVIPQPRWLSSVDPFLDLPGAFIVGGFKDLAFTPADDVDFFSEPSSAQDCFRSGTATLGGQPLELRDDRAGSTVTSLDNGFMLVAGGITTEDRVLTTAELLPEFVDPAALYSATISCGGN